MQFDAVIEGCGASLPAPATLMTGIFRSLQAASKAICTAIEWASLLHQRCWCCIRAKEACTNQHKMAITD